MSDILERAKNMLAEGYTAINEGIVRDLIAEVERLRFELAVAQLENPKTITIASYKLEAEQQERNYLGRLHMREQIAAKDARIKELEAENKKLEEAFLRSNAAMRYYQEGNRGPWPQVGEKFKEPYQKKSREALEKIKEGGKDD